METYDEMNGMTKLSRYFAISWLKLLTTSSLFIIILICVGSLI